MNWVTGSPPKFDTLLASWYPTYMQSFIISHSSCAEQYGDMSSDTQNHLHTIKPPTAGVRQLGHTSKTNDNANSRPDNTYKNTVLIGPTNINININTNNSNTNTNNDLYYNSPYVCLSVFAKCRSQFLLDRLGRCL